jgi:hypothetical protein
MPTEYRLDKDLGQAVSALINNCPDLEGLREQKYTFVAQMVTKTNANKEKVETTGEPVVIRKVSKADEELIGYDFKVYVDECRWEKAAVRKAQEILLFDGLLSVSVVTSTTGKPKIVRTRPDIMVRHATLRRYPHHFDDKLLDMTNRLQAAHEVQLQEMEREKASGGRGPVTKIPVRRPEITRKPERAAV